MSLRLWKDKTEVSSIEDGVRAFHDNTNTCAEEEEEEKEVGSQLAFYVNLHRAVIGPSG